MTTTFRSGDRVWHLSHGAARLDRHGTVLSTERHDGSPVEMTTVRWDGGVTNTHNTEYLRPVDTDVALRGLEDVWEALA